MGLKWGRRLMPVFVFAIGFFSAASGQESTPIRFTGYFGYETGEIMSGRFKTFMVDHRWIGNTVGSLTADAAINERTRALLTLEGKWWLGTFPAEKATNKEYGIENNASFYLYQAQGIFSLVKKENLSLDLSFGIIPFKYNPEVRNLGEYLFRSIGYPGIVFNHFDFPLDRLSGLRLNLTQESGLGKLTADAFLLSERKVRPFNDFSVAGVVGYNLMKFLDVGLGVNLYRIIPVNSSLTSPREGATMYDVENPVFDTTGYFLTGDSLFYTFSATKIMARATLDPLAFLREGDLGKWLGQGGKIYGEVDVLGLKNYPRNDSMRNNVPMAGVNRWGYDSLLNKMPLTFGVTVPVPFLLDICSVEFEYYRMRYPNSYRNVFVDGRPVPSESYIDLTSGVVPANSYSESDNWKWSIYMKKNVTKNFHVVAQASRDHQAWMIPGSQWGQISDWDDICLRPNNWIWTVKTEMNF